MPYTECAPAKINLGLQVLRRREDGYHDIRSVMVPIAWYDRVRVEAAPEGSLSCSDDSVPAGTDNLCWRAVEALADRVGRKPRVAVHLEKNVPVGAGLGGGSSDAAAVLRALTDLWDLEVGDEELRRVGARLGSDVPFFVNPRPVLAEGRGERLTPVEEGLQFAYHWVVVVPGQRVATAEAYRWVAPDAEDRPNPAEVLASTEPSRWAHKLVNDFEDPVARRVPAVGRIRARLRRAGAAYVSLSGSGSAVYGLFLEADRARRVAERLREDRADRTVWVGPPHPTASPG